MNVELLRRIQAHNTAHSEQLHMGHGLQESDCGTTGCIAGHACLLSGFNPKRGVWSNIEFNAVRLLEISNGQAGVLFHASDWPCKFSAGLSFSLPGTPEYAAIVNARIDRFIETGGAE